MNELPPDIPDRAYAGDPLFEKEVHEAATSASKEDQARALFGTIQKSNVVVELNVPGFPQPSEQVKDDKSNVVVTLNEPSPSLRAPASRTSRVGRFSRTRRGSRGLSTSRIDSLNLRPKPKTEDTAIETEKTVADHTPEIKIRGGELSTPLIDSLDLRRKP